VSAIRGAIESVINPDNAIHQGGVTKMWALGTARDLKPPGDNQLFCRRFSGRILAVGFWFIKCADDKTAAGNNNVFEQPADQVRLPRRRNIFQVNRLRIYRQFTLMKPR
jgi:hypothetical protein